MTNNYTFSRRRFLGGLAAAGAAGAVATTPFSQAFAKNVTVGFIYVGPRGDFGYNQAHAEGAAAVKKIPGIKVVEEEKVPETIAVQKTMESMINLDGATLLFPTSFGYYNPHILKMAKKYPNVTFMHSGGLWSDKHPKNAHSYFGYIDEAQYLSGIVAGYATKTKKLGFVAAKPIPQVLRNINAFTLGARLVNPGIETQVIFTGEWSMPLKEAEATNSLADQGADVVTCHVDGPKVVMETAAKRAMFLCGYHASQAPLDPQKYLTGAEWDWPATYTKIINDYMAGKPIDNLIRGGLKEAIVKSSAYGPAVTAEARKHADAVKAKFLTGNVALYKGPLKDNKGKIVIPVGTSLEQTNIELEKMNYLVEGVIGSVSS